jgi:hypothetical protein
LDPKSLPTYFVGYSTTSKAYRFWEPTTNRIIESSDFTINEYSGKFDVPPDLGPSSFTQVKVDTYLPIPDRQLPDNVPQVASILITLPTSATIIHD